MASKSKNRKSQSTRNQRRQRKEQKRKQRKSRESKSSSISLIAKKHQQQVASLQPRPWPGENLLDIAVFDADARAALDDADQVTVTAVASALDKHAAGQLDDAEQCVAQLSRKSPMSDWRMLIRGLSQWDKNNLDGAAKLWSRLDESRRPARIAQALQLSLRDDLTTLNTSGSRETEASAKPCSPTDPSPTREDNSTKQYSLNPSQIDKSLLLAAKIVRKTRIDRSAIKLARKGLAQNQEFGLEFDNEPLPIGPAQISWLKAFARSFRHTERDLIRALELLALERASEQHFTDIFESAVKAFRGPAHDPENTLRSHFFHATSPSLTDNAATYLRRYRKGELASNHQVSEPLRNALLSELALTIAEDSAEAAQWPDNPFDPPDFVLPSIDLAPTIRREFCTAIETYPQNHRAHERYNDWIKSQIESIENDKPLLKQLQQEQLSAMQAWSMGVPSAERPHWYLAETLLQGSQPELAEPHIQWLLATRPSDLRICAMPWSLQLHKLMQLCRRKSNLSAAQEQLDQVLAQWPEWLSVAWQPYLTAALLMRREKSKEYETLRRSICAQSNYARDSAPDACMMLAAAQKFHVPAASLKPLRQAVEDCVQNLHFASSDDIVAVGSFFWSLCQSGIRYPAMRYHQRPLGRTLLFNLSKQTDLTRAIEQNRTMQEALLWTAEHRFWSTKRGLQTPRAFIECAGESVPVAAAFLRAFVLSSGRLKFDEHVTTAIALLNESYRAVAEPFYRQWYADILAECQVKERIYKSYWESSRARASRFDDDDCPCPECTARRKWQQSEATQFDLPSAEFSMTTEDIFDKPQQSELF